ncbi:MAG: nicotinate (nicotinamide) nucleotide adenylyltransferase [Acidobacteria bacterium]|nr:nicotinate (nicotinamide) nucleotide adenylyltransferase [Acidobacteriota bacterium]
MRIGYYGGTFDPPHRGHLAVAQAAAAAFALDRVELAPTGRQPLKDAAPHATFTQRLDMVRLLCGESALLHASDIEAPRANGSPNYTVDTLRTLARNCDELFAIVGADSFLDLRRWREPDELLRIAQWIVVSRPGWALDNLTPLALTAEQRARVHLLTTVHVDISATGIRAKLAQGGASQKKLADAVAETLTNELTPEVLRYIREHHLYISEENQS